MKCVHKYSRIIQQTDDVMQNIADVSTVNHVSIVEYNSLAL